MANDKRNIEVSFTAESFKHFDTQDSIAVIVDIFRATSSICTAFMNGVKKIIPVGTLDEVKEYKAKGYIVAAERDGVIRDFADFGNSPENFTPEAIGGKEVAYSTTNGTKAFQMASHCQAVVVGAFLNLSALTQYLCAQDKDVIIFCAGWKNKFSLEDSVFAGALSQQLIVIDKFRTACDSALAAMDLWNIAKSDLVKYMDKAANRNRLKKLGLDNCIPYCCKLDQTDIIPVLKDEYLIDIKKCKEVQTL